jgi:hypothetical protein
MIARLGVSGRRRGYEGKLLARTVKAQFPTIFAAFRYGRGLTVPSQVVIAVRL